MSVQSVTATRNANERTVIMSDQTSVIEIERLIRRYGRTEAVNGRRTRTLLRFLRFGLCVLLAMALPAALTLVFEGAHAVRFNVPFATVVILLAAVGLYVSSLSDSGVKALLLAGPAALSLMMLMPLLGNVAVWAARSIRVTPKPDVFGLEPTAVIAFTIFGFLIG